MFNPDHFSQAKPLSRRFRDELSDMARVVGSLQSMESAIAQLTARLQAREDEPFFHAKITGHSGGGTYPIWTYSWDEVYPGTTSGSNTDFTTATGGRTGTSNAINVAESGNTASVAYGFAVALSSGAWKLTAASFTNIEFKPIPTNTIVFMRTVLTASTGGSRFEFWAPNPLDGSC